MIGGSSWTGLIVTYTGPREYMHRDRDDLPANLVGDGGENLRDVLASRKRTQAKENAYSFHYLYKVCTSICFCPSSSSFRGGINFLSIYNFSMTVSSQTAPCPKLKSLMMWYLKDILKTSHVLILDMFRFFGAVWEAACWASNILSRCIFRIQRPLCIFGRRKVPMQFRHLKLL